MEHAYDPIMKLHHTVWHNDPHMVVVIRDLIEKVRPDRWIETGTHLGWTSVWLAENYPDLAVYTVENCEPFFEMAYDNLFPFPQVALTYGHSPEYLEKLLPLLRRGLSVFWLDAHWAPKGGGGPLLEECKLLTEMLDRYVIIVDDFWCESPDFKGDIWDGRKNDLSYVAPVLGARCYRPNYPAENDNKGYGIFIKGVDYVPPPLFTKEDIL